MVRKSRKSREVVIYNFDVQKQRISLLYRGDKVPSHLKEYQRLWRMKDPQRLVETLIISV